MTELPSTFLDDIEFSTLQSTENLANFSCNEPLLNDFLIENALDDMKNMYSVTHIAKYKSEIVGLFYPNY